MVSKKDIQLTLDLLGVVPGDTVLMHSALTAIGPVEGGAEAVIDAIMEYLGEEGTLCMSALTFSDKVPFDAATSKASVGYLAENFRCRPGTLRSLHPVHSVTASGKYAAWITAGHEELPTGCGEGSPYTKIRDLGGKILLLGVDMDRNTSMHCMEEFLDVSYLVETTIPAPTYQPDKEIFTLKKFVPGHRDFKGRTPEMRRAGILREACMGKAVVRCMNMAELFDWGMEKMRKDPLYFLCDNPHCSFCSKARERDGR